MNLKEKTQSIVDVIKLTKSRWVASKPENPDIAIYLHFWRGDELVATLQCEVDRDRALGAGLIGAAGFGADTMSMAFESFHSQLPKSPITGEAWMPHELQFLAESHPTARQQGWVNECITVSAHERGGDYMLITLPYQIVDDQVEWLEEKVVSISSDEMEEEGSGVMFQFLQDAMSRPTIMQTFANLAEKDEVAGMVQDLISDPEKQFFHTDMATYAALQERELCTAIMLSAAPGSEREMWLTERLGDPEEPPIEWPDPTQGDEHANVDSPSE